MYDSIITTFGAVCEFLILLMIYQDYRKSRRQPELKMPIPTKHWVRWGLMLLLSLGPPVTVYFNRQSFETGTPQPSKPNPLLSPEQHRISNHLAAIAANWGTYRYQEEIGRSFQNEAVLLDGRKFSNCTFSNVTFVYEGTAPFEFNGKPNLTGTVSIESGNQIVKQTFNMFNNLGLTMPGRVINKPLEPPDQ